MPATSTYILLFYIADLDFWFPFTSPLQQFLIQVLLFFNTPSRIFFSLPRHAHMSSLLTSQSLETPIYIRFLCELRHQSASNSKIKQERQNTLWTTIINGCSVRVSKFKKSPRILHFQLGFLRFSIWDSLNFLVKIRDTFVWRVWVRLFVFFFNSYKVKKCIKYIYNIV